MLIRARGYPWERPAALFESPGTAVGVSVTWLTSAQVTLLTWMEVGYALARLENVRCEVDGSLAEITNVYAYVARLGAYCPAPDGEPGALAAVPAQGRTARELTQEQLLDHVAPLLLGNGAGAEDVVRAACTDPASLAARGREVLWPLGRKLSPSRMTPLPADGVASIRPWEAARLTAQALRVVLAGQLPPREAAGPRESPRNVQARYPFRTPVTSR